jgi:DNA-binding NtrC family response regulator
MPNFETGEPSEIIQASLWDDVGSAARNDTRISAGAPLQEKSDFASYFARNQPLNLNQFLSEIEETLITTALEHADGVVEKAAQNLGLTQEDLVEKIKFYAVMNRSFQTEV